VNIQDISAHWVALHEALGVAAPIADEDQYLKLLAQVDALVDQTGGDDAHPLWGLIAVVGDHIREYEDRVHPWPDTSTPATVLASLMEEHGLKQSDLPEIGAQSVVSAVLAGKRKLNLRQVKALAKRFSVSLEVLT
jgi:HTH-type transcriptional regulator / antitoxin HigA